MNDTIESCSKTDSINTNVFISLNALDCIDSSEAICYDSVAMTADTTCISVQGSNGVDFTIGQSVKESVPVLTLIMLIIMVVQLYKQIKDSRKATETYNNYLEGQKEGVDKIVRSVQKNGLIKSVILKNNLIKNFDDLCYYLANDTNVAQDIDQGYVRRTLTSLDILYNLMKYYKINNKDIDRLIISIKNDLQEIGNNQLPRTISGRRNWVNKFKENSSLVIQEIDKLLDKEDFSK